MIALFALIAGAVFGWFRAARRGGTISDRAMYAVGHAIAFGLAAFVIGILIDLSGLFANV